MRGLILAAVILLSCAGAEAAEGMLKDASGLSLPPDAELYEFSGEPLPISSFKGRVVVLHFWATWCLPCVDEMPELHKLEKMFRGRPFTVLCITQESAAHVRKWSEVTGMKMRFVLDREGKLSDLFEVSAIPASIVLGPDGRPRYLNRGPGLWTSGENVKAIEALMEKIPEGDTE